MKRLKKSPNVPKWLRILIPSTLVVIWLAAGAIGGPYFGKISEVASNDQATFLPESAESTKVSEEVKKFQDSSTAPAIVAFYDDGNTIEESTVTKIKEATAKFSDIDEIKDGVSPPVVASDSKAVLVAVNVSSEAEYKDIVPILDEKLTAANLDIDHYITGPVGFSADFAKAFAGIDGLLLATALTVVFIILLIVYRSPILPFVVLLNSIFALSAAILLVFYLAQAGIIDLNGQVQGILFILVVGAATDYALLYVARYKEELLRHKDTLQAIITSWKRSIEPITAAGGTVIAGLLCLLLSDLSSNKALGPVGAIGIIFAILSALTLLPSLLYILGRKVFWPRIPQYIEKNASTDSEKGVWQKIANFISRNARATWITTCIVLVAAAAGMLQLKADGVAQSEFILGDSKARDGQVIISEHFPGSSGTPVQVIAAANKQDQLVKALDSDPSVASVAVRANNSPSGTMPLGKDAVKLKETIRTSVEQELSKSPSPFKPSVETLATQAYPFKDATPKIVDNQIFLEATLSETADSLKAQTAVERLRKDLRVADSSAQVGGISAIQLDTQVSAKHDRAVVIPSVLVVITIILMILLRSILAPILLLATTLLSFGSALGIAALLFNNVWGFPGADPSVVLYGFIFLVALGIDYNIFLMTRVREESLKIGTRPGVLRGLIVTGGVITSAGVVLASTFAALGVIPILFLVQLAFIVAFGVLLDTIVVRSLLVPALVHDIGRTVWWPLHKKIK